MKRDHDKSSSEEEPKPRKMIKGEENGHSNDQKNGTVHP